MRVRHERSRHCSDPGYRNPRHIGSHRLFGTVTVDHDKPGRTCRQRQKPGAHLALQCHPEILEPFFARVPRDRDLPFGGW